jgi:hypothetical protein
MADGVIALSLIGGDERLERELSELVAQLGDIALLPEASADRADALLIADGQRGAALDRLRVELATRPSRRIMLIGAHGTIDLAEAKKLSPGDLYELLPENDIHRVRTTSEVASISLHLLGNNNGCIWRHQFRPEERAVKPFKSGWLNVPCDEEDPMD